MNKQEVIKTIVDGMLAGKLTRRIKMDKREMINTIVADLKDWMERDSYGFWHHVEELERKYLNKMTEKDLKEAYQAILE